jgi:hypothetical protein
LTAMAFAAKTAMMRENLHFAQSGRRRCAVRP